MHWFSHGELETIVPVRQLKPSTITLIAPTICSYTVSQLTGRVSTPRTAVMLARRADYGPQMFPATLCPRTVRHRDPHDLFAALWIDPSHRGRFAVCSDDVVAYPLGPHGRPTGGSEDGLNL